MASAPARAENCLLGPPKHDKGPLVWMNLDQAEFDAAYDQTFYAPLARLTLKRRAASAEAMRMLRTPVIATYGTNETPEFQRHNRDFVAALKAAGKPAQLIEAVSYDHFEMAESLGHPYGPTRKSPT